MGRKGGRQTDQVTGEGKKDDCEEQRACCGETVSKRKTEKKGKKAIGFMAVPEDQKYGRGELCKLMKRVRDLTGKKN